MKSDEHPSEQNDATLPETEELAENAAKLESALDADETAAAVAPPPKASGRPRLIDPNEELTDEAARQKVISLALPAVAENLLMSLVGMLDMMMVGGVGAAAIASVGLTNQPMMFAMAIFMALNTGTTAVVARLFGAGEPEKANKAARQTLVMVFVMGVVISIIMFFLAETILLFMGAQEDTMQYAVTYFQIVAVSLIFNTLMNSVNSMVRGSGDTRTPLYNNILTNLVNLVGNFILINGYFGFPQLGVTGAAVATLLSRMVGSLLALYVVMRGHHQITIPLREKFVFDFDIARRVLLVGIPAAIEQFVMRFGQILFTRTVSGLGTTVYAAHQVALNIVSLSFSPGQGFGMAATTLVGQSLGAKRPDWAEKCGWMTQRVGMVVAGTMALVFFFFGDKIAWFYAPNPEDYLVVQNAAIALKIIAFVQIPQSSQFILAGALRGAGDTKWTLISTAVGVWGFRVVLSYLFVRIFQWGLVGAWLAMAADQLMRSLVVLLRFRSGKWKLREV